MGAPLTRPYTRTRTAVAFHRASGILSLPEYVLKRGTCHPLSPRAVTQVTACDPGHTER